MSKKSIFYTTADLNYSDVSPTLDLNFVENQKVPPFVNVTRNSQTTYVDKFGILRTADINQPVFEWDPITGKCLGARIWGAVTNLLLWSEDFGNAIWYSQGTAPAVSVNAAIAPNGTYTADRITFAAGDSRCNQTFTSTNGATYTFSVYVKAVSSSLNQLRLAMYDGATQFNSTEFTISNTQWQRISFTATSNVSSIFANVQIRNSYPNYFANDIYVWGAQLQTGSIVGPYVPTTTTTASSTADVWSITGADFTRIYNPNETTIYLDALGFASGGRIYFDDGVGASERFFLRFNDPNWGMYSFSGGVGDGTAIFVNNNPTARIASTIAADGLAITVNGAAVVTDASITMPQNISQMWIGSIRGSSSFANGYIRRLTIYPKRLTNSQLVQLTE